MAKLENQEKRKRNLLKVTLIISIVLMIMKLFAYFLTNSVAILTDAAESLVNVIAGGFALYSVIIAARPKDKDHPYGHGKIEFLAAGAEGFLILSAGFFIVGKSIYNLFFPEPIQELGIGIVLTGIAGVVNLIMARMLISGGKKLHSITLHADGKHLESDAFTSAGLIAGLALIWISGIMWLDNVIAIAFAGVLVYSGYRIVRKSVSGVMDEVDAEVVTEIARILEDARQPEWIDFHNLRVIRYGANLHVDCHMTMPWYWDLKKVHDELDRIEDIINQNMDRPVELFIHPDPCVPDSCFVCDMPNCNARKNPFQKKIDWSMENIMELNKHRKD